MNENSDFFDLVIERDTLLPQMDDSRKKEEYTDVKLQVGDKLFAAHRVVLSHSSPVLKALISDQWSATNICLISDQYVDPEIMEDLLSFLYTGRIKLTPDNVHAVCMAAHFLQVPKLLENSVKHLCRFITIENVLTLFKFSTTCELGELNYSCLQFVNNNHEGVFENSEILEFSFKNFRDLIVGLKKFWTEMLRENTFECIVRWSEKDLSGRSDDLPILLKNIPLEELPLKFLSETVSTHPLVKDSISGIEAVSAALANYQTHSNLELQTNQNLIVFGGMDDNDDLVLAMNCYDSHTGVWKKLPDFPFDRSHFATTIMNQQDILICGGHTQTRPQVMTASIDKFDWSRKTWSKLAEMPFTCNNVSIAVCRGDLYVFVPNPRESDIENPSSSKVLCYSFDTKQWKYVKSMNEEQDTGELVEHKDYLYFTGGSSIVERYDPARDEWTYMAEMASLNFHDVTSNQEKIFVHGADFFEEYDPETDIWSSLPLPPVGDFTSLVSLNGKLLIVGGIVRTDRRLVGPISDLIYEFNHSTQKWTEFTKMDAALMYASVVAGSFY